jgi:F-type H+-transporting ATPase subunit b
MEIKGDLSLFTIVAFVFFLVVLGKLAWRPMIEGLDKREAGIRKAIDDAEDNRRKSEAMLADYQKKLREAEQTVQAMVAEARRDAERTSKDLIASAQKEVDQIRLRAREEIRQAKDTALAEVFSQVNSQVILAAEHVLGRTLGDADQDRLVTEALAHVSR